MSDCKIQDIVRTNLEVVRRTFRWSDRVGCCVECNAIRQAKGTPRNRMSWTRNCAGELQKQCGVQKRVLEHKCGVPSRGTEIHVDGDAECCGDGDPRSEWNLLRKYDARSAPRRNRVGLEGLWVSEVTKVVQQWFRPC